MENNIEPGNVSGMRVRVDRVGRVVIPIELRQRFGIRPGDDIMVVSNDDGLHLLTFEKQIKKAQAYFKQFAIPEQSVVDELLNDRREEFERE